MSSDRIRYLQRMLASGSLEPHERSRVLRELWDLGMQQPEANSSREARFNWDDLGKSTIIEGVPVASLTRPRGHQQLLRVDLARMSLDQAAGYAAGSWVLALDAEIVEDVPAAGNRQIWPLVADITVGAGGAQHRVQVDATRSVLAIPSGMLDVSIFWDELPESIRTAGALPAYSLPLKVRVTGTIQRSYAKPCATRTFLRNVQPGGTGSGDNLKIPRFATCWRFTGTEDQWDTGGDLQHRFQLRSGTNGGGLILDRDTDFARVNAWVASQASRPVHPHAETFVDDTVNVSAADSLYSVVFNICL